MNSSGPSPIVLFTAPHPGGSPISFGFDNTYARLPEQLLRTSGSDTGGGPAPDKAECGTGAETWGWIRTLLASARGVEILAGNRVAEGAEPLAQAYAGHQFGSFVPQLGDGRAILLGEVMARDGARYDIQLKGSGTTRRSPAAATAEPRSVRSCASTL
jgi:serine/tyrosine/threonine adenylyltransferase